MRVKNFLYIIFMVIFAILSYIFIDRGLNVKTRRYVNYQETSDVVYKVYLHDNQEYTQEYLNMGERYISEIVNSINFDISYKNLFSKNINGYYSYDAIANLIIYEGDVDDIVFKKKYVVLDSKTEVLNQNDIKDINILLNAIIDYDEYKEEFIRFSNKYQLGVSGYLEVNFNIHENLQFQGINNLVTDDKVIKVIIPISYDTFRINVINNNNNISNYYDFSTKEKINYLFLLFGAFSLSLSISFLALVVRDVYFVSKKQSDYRKELKKILLQYDQIIVNVKKFYNKKKYNLIYVDSFKELLDVYNKIENPISFRELKKNYEAIFVITNEDDAWIYRMTSNK